MTRQPKMHVHRLEHLPPEEPEAEGLATRLIVAAIVIAFLAVFVIPTVLGWHG